MKLYYNKCRQNNGNTTYPYSIEVHSVEDLEKVVQFDHVSAEYKNNYRKNSNFIQADCNMFDVDNAESDNPSDWITPIDVQKAFPNVPFYVSYSRNHMKHKNGKSPRPKFHVYFPDAVVTDGSDYANYKKSVCTYFPAFDPNAKDAARFFFGVEEPKVEYFEGSVLLYDFMKTVASNNTHSGSGKNHATEKTEVIPEGQRNSTLHKFAVRMLKRYGSKSSQAYQAFIAEAAKCAPPLENGELSDIWTSASSFFHRVIATDPNYISPNQYNTSQHIKNLKPLDFTDVGEARVFAREYAEKLRYSPATKYLLYTGTVWKESDLGAHGLAQELTEHQLQEAKTEIKSAKLAKRNADKRDDEKTKSETAIDLNNAERYRNFVLSVRDSRRITAMLKEAQPMLEIDPAILDADGYKLNTPSGTVDLCTTERYPHNPSDYCTKITKASPGTDGKELFDEFLKTITCEDKALEEFLQIIAGMSAVGKVFSENLIIAYGSGRNGKSTFFNLLAKVMGDYSGNLSAETLTANCRKNKSPEYAELRGKRLVVASELEEGMQLSTAIVKKLCSTDDVYAEKKYKAPFSYKPSHTVVLCTNHLPQVRTLDVGTWRRIVVVPFNAVITANSDIKNYADYLLEKAGGAVLSWIIDGAYKFIVAGNRIEPPQSVKDATEQYREDNDWLQRYIAERCDVNGAYLEQAGALYQDYREYCVAIGEHALSDRDFKKATEIAGFARRKRNTGWVVFGLRLKRKVNSADTSTVIPFRVTGSDNLEQDFFETGVEF